MLNTITATLKTDEGQGSEGQAAEDPRMKALRIELQSHLVREQNQFLGHTTCNLDFSDGLLQQASWHRSKPLSPRARMDANRIMLRFESYEQPRRSSLRLSMKSLIEVLRFRNASLRFSSENLSLVKSAVQMTVFQSMLAQYVRQIWLLCLQTPQKLI